MNDTVALLADLRAKKTPTTAALDAFAAGLADGRVSDAQAGAFAMAVCCGDGLGAQGRVALTNAMRDSGRVLQWDLDGPIIDKHSTGGIGDTVSLLVAPILAACGAYTPMISGRGLGHTGGTLDKLEAIPGLRVNYQVDEFKAQVAEIGCAIIAAGTDIAPADRRLYAIRDLTATVDNIDLITASILSKKLAAGPDALVLDIKTGSGAFMHTPSLARDLADILVQTACAAGCPTRAVISDMDEPLASAMGNATELAVVMKALTGGRHGKLVELSLVIAAHGLVMSRLSDDLETAERVARRALSSGRAAAVFGRMIAAQGGPTDFVENWHRYLPKAEIIAPLPAAHAGYLSAVDGRALGQLVVDLGAGRDRIDASIDPSVGLSKIARRGAWLEKGDPLAIIHAADQAAWDRAANRLRGIVKQDNQPPELPELILGEVH